MDLRSQSYRESPQGPESCQVQGAGCLGGASVQIYCRTEGRSVRACQPCYSRWQYKARSLLSDRCPLCADLPSPVRATPHAPAPPVPLTGPAAEAIDRAMHAEGLTVDIRQKVLARLNRDASWLGYAKAPGQAEAGIV